jgi:hypothetical protein
MSGSKILKIWIFEAFGCTFEACKVYTVNGKNNDINDIFRLHA